MIRGLWNHAGVLYEVDDTKLYSIDSAGLKTERGTLDSRGGPVDFASNLTQLAINDETFLYVYTPTAGTFETVAAYSGGARISFLDQRGVFQFNGTQKFGWTALGDFTTIDALDFYSAEGSPDVLVSHVAAYRELYMAGEESTEIWDSVGGLTVFSRSSAAIDYGCVAAYSMQKTAQAVTWLGRDRSGHAQVISAAGHQARRISNRAIEEKFEGIQLNAARAFAYTDGGQSFYCLNVPGIDTTLVYDETFSQWHERGEWVNGVWTKWSPTCHAFAYGRHYFGCGATLAISDPDEHTYLGNVKRRQRIAPVISSPTYKRVSFPKLAILCEKGTGATLMLRYSDDNGATWSDWKYATVGEIGQYARRADFNRLGSGFDRVFDVVMTDDAPFNPVAVHIPLV